MNTRFIRTLLFTLFVLTGLAGCSTVQLLLSFPDEPQHELREGEILFDQGKFDEAARIFQDVYNADTTEQIRNTALYNLACTKLITATNAAEYLAAIALLSDWQRSTSGGPYYENPNMVIEALKEGSLILRQDLLAIENQRDDALSQIDSQKAVLNKQDERINQLTHTLKEYQHQINELESIDQKLQEKKKPL